MIRAPARTGKTPLAPPAGRWLAAALGALLLCLLPSLALAAGGSERPRVWADDTTGYAIGGFDPVDYYVLGRPHRPPAGEAVELYWGGVSWRFRNEGNRDAFLLDPGVYCPRYAGHDPVKLAAGRAVHAEPLHFDIFRNRLYLFNNADNLARWRRDRERLLDAVDRRWPQFAREQGYEASEPVAAGPGGALPAPGNGPAVSAPPAPTPPDAAASAAAAAKDDDLPGGMTRDGTVLMPRPSATPATPPAPAH